jgi:site-specific DNA-cytosine methylase
MNVLVACEESQRVCSAFRSKGHRAFSCDLRYPSGDIPQFHIKGDIVTVFERSMSNWGIEWDLVIGFPPCTDLCVSGARWFPEKQMDGRQKSAIDFFMWFVNLPVKKICIENPVGIMSSIYRRPDQILQPWQFGHGEVKKTCLWLKGLPILMPTNVVEGREPRVWKMGKGKSVERSKTYEGVAMAMADQWG